ncbi:TetR/AcrR family transcriptional regulator [Kingella potus]|uniref:TetR/AcrR family transcriptional regulator n=1 Tax=Kingella potus TaxID=265175 RepID=UPI001FD341A0|nr:TetR/AcrR family transcriptional regulator [Kingella potus]UOP00364.1 TetR/AcrR family transcriptional regulator [Kingella potus]
MDTREKIITTAYNTFYRHGFHACGVELLAQRSGVTKRTLYAHFGSKEGLAEAVLAYRHAQFMDNMRAALDRLPLAQTVEAYLQFIVDWTQSEDFYGCLFINACAEFSENTALPKRHAAAHKREIRALLLARLQEAGFAEAEQTADMLFLLGEGMIVAAQTGQGDAVTAQQATAQALLQADL